MAVGQVCRADKNQPIAGKLRDQGTVIGRKIGHLCIKPTACIGARIGHDRLDQAELTEHGVVGRVTIPLDHIRIDPPTVRWGRIANSRRAGQHSACADPGDDIDIAAPREQLVGNQGICLCAPTLQEPGAKGTIFPAAGHGQHGDDNIAALFNFPFVRSRIGVASIVSKARISGSGLIG